MGDRYAVVTYLVPVKKGANDVPDILADGVPKNTLVTVSFIDAPFNTDTLHGALASQVMPFMKAREAGG